MAWQTWVLNSSFGKVFFFCFFLFSVNFSEKTLFYDKSICKLKHDVPLRSFHDVVEMSAHQLEKCLPGWNSLVLQKMIACSGMVGYLPYKLWTRMLLGAASCFQHPDRTQFSQDTAPHSWEKKRSYYNTLTSKSGRQCSSAICQYQVRTWHLCQDLQTHFTSKEFASEQLSWNLCHNVSKASGCFIIIIIICIQSFPFSLYSCSSV